MKFLKTCIILGSVLIFGNTFAASVFECEKGGYEKFDCFIEKATEKQDVRMTMTNTLDIFGIINETTSLVTLETKETGQYLYSAKVLDSRVYFSEEMINEAKIEGTSQADIDKQVLELNQTQDSLIGITNKCAFSETDYPKFLAILEENKLGNFSTEDFSFADCNVMMHAKLYSTQTKISHLAPGGTLREGGNTWIGNEKGEAVLQSKPEVETTPQKLHSEPLQVSLPQTGSNILSRLWESIRIFFGL